MLYLDIENYMLQIKDGALKNVGPPSKSATAKLYDIETAEARAFGDNRIKFVCRDDEGNEVQLALFPEHVETILKDIDDIKQSGEIPEFN